VAVRRPPRACPRCRRRAWDSPLRRPGSPWADAYKRGLEPADWRRYLPLGQERGQALSSRQTTDQKLPTDGVFRHINERIVELGERFGFRDEPLLELVCECGDSACTERVSIAHDAYDDVRAHMGRYLVRAGHEHACRVVFDGNGYVVVED
jgi:hypothetical protein